MSNNNEIIYDHMKIPETPHKVNKLSWLVCCQSQSKDGGLEFDIERDSTENELLN